MQTATMDLIFSLKLINSELKEERAATALDNKNIVCLYFGKHERFPDPLCRPNKQGFMDPIGVDCTEFEKHLKQKFYPAARQQGVEIIYVSGDTSDRKKKMEKVAESCLEWDHQPGGIPDKKIPGFYGFKIPDVIPLYGALTEDYKLFECANTHRDIGYTEYDVFPRFVVLKKDGTLISKNAAHEVLTMNSEELIQKWQKFSIGF